MTLRYLSVCSGIEAASVAWEPLGWQCAGLAEIEPFPRAVLRHRLGAVPVDFDEHRHSPQSNVLPLFGDFTKIEAHHVGPIDLLVGGTPCQSFSVAGKRLGLDDPRGHLTLEFLALAKRVRPRWIVWENVPGVLSDDGGRTFGTFLGLLGQLGFRWSYRVLDAQFVRVAGHERAVPQRRRRVFVVGHFGDDARAIPVLFDRESLRGNPAPRREAGKGIAVDVAPSLVSSCRGVERTGETRGQDPVVAEVAPTLNAAFGTKQGLEDQHILGGQGCSLPPVSLCLNAGAMGRQDAESETLIPTIGAVFDVATAYAIQERAVSENLENGQQGKGYQEGHAYTLEARNKVQAVAHTLRGEGFDASEDGTGRGTPIVPVAFPAEMSGTQCASAENLAPALSVKHTTAIAFDTTQITSAANYSNPKPGDPCHPLARGAHAPAVAFDMRGRDGGAQFEGPHQTANIRAASGGSSRSYVSEQWAVRRLTPRECERLQGFQDDWTAIPWRGKPADLCPDGPRYKACGNSMAVNVMRWIGQRIDMVERSIAATGRAGGE